MSLIYTKKQPQPKKIKDVELKLRVIFRDSIPEDFAVRILSMQTSRAIAPDRSTGAGIDDPVTPQAP